MILRRLLGARELTCKAASPQYGSPTGSWSCWDWYMAFLSGPLGRRQRHRAGLGASLGIAVLGSLLATSYKDKLTDLLGGHLPLAAMDTAKDSVGGGLAVAEQVAKNPGGDPGRPRP